MLRVWVAAPAVVLEDLSNKTGSAPAHTAVKGVKGLTTAVEKETEGVLEAEMGRDLAGSTSKAWSGERI